MTQLKKPVTLERRKKLKESSKRMQEVKDDFQMNISELERHLKVTHSLISNVLDKRNAMTKTVATPLNQNYGYSYEWLMYGTLPKFKPRKIRAKIELNKKVELSQLEHIIKLLEDKFEEQKKTNKLLEELIKK